MAVLGKRKRADVKHPYLAGNFAPVKKTLPLTPCTYTGTIPVELIGGEYVRNGVNPITNEDLGRDAHWFDGDGMLTGVSFQKTEEGVVPYFVNSYVLTDLLLSAQSSPFLRAPIMPSIATLVNPMSSLFTVCYAILRATCLVILSHLPGSSQAIKKISVANTHFLYHDGRALATCESGPPMRVQLPGLETVGWFNGNKAEGEPDHKPEEPGFGGEGFFSWVKEWTTGHPKVDPVTKEMILFHCGFVKPYVHYSVIPSTKDTHPEKQQFPKLLNLPVPGCSGGRMMHDFGVSRNHTIIMDLPLILDPFNQLKGKPPLHYDDSKPSRFGVFPRRDPTKVKWFEAPACCIFHTANSWDTYDEHGNTTAVNFLACRQTSAAVVFASGNIEDPDLQRQYTESSHASILSNYDLNATSSDSDIESRCPDPSTSKQATADSQSNLTTNHSTEATDSQCRLYHYTFSLTSPTPQISTQHALSALPVEFPTLNPAYEMRDARYVYCASTSISRFDTALGKTAKIDVLVKFDVRTLMQRGEECPPDPVTGTVDNRGLEEVIRDQEKGEDGGVKVFRLPEGWFGQEARFVARRNARDEDDGWLLFYVFDEGQLVGGEAGEGCVSELWVLEARGMSEVVARVRCPMRVPYGLHGSWFGEEEVRGQRAVEGFRKLERVKVRRDGGGWGERAWMRARGFLERAVG